MTLAEAAAYARVHPREMRRALQQRELACIRRGGTGHYKIRRSALNKWLASMEIPARRSVEADL